MLRAENSTEHQRTIFGPVFLYERAGFCTKNSKYFCHNDWPSIFNCAKLNKLEKTIKIEKKKTHQKVCFLKVFQIFFKLGSILAHQTSRSMLSGSWCFFCYPWGPWGWINSGDILILTFVFDISVWQRHLAKFFQFFKLKPGITYIDFTCIRMRNITF